MKNFLHNLKKVKRNGGQALIISVIFFLFISLAIVTGLVSPTIRHFKIANDLILSKQSFLLSESGIEDAYYRLKNAMTIDDTTIITLNGNTATTSIVDAGGEQTISTVGDTSNRERTNELVLTAGVGVSFNYGVQVGQGGIDMTGSSGINGNVYANGPITGSSSSFIVGTAISGNAPASTADQTNGSGAPLYNLNFGNATGTQDIAQSFRVTSTDPVNKFSFYIRKVLSPGNETVRIVTDNSGSPSTTNIATGTLLSSAVTTTYDWVDVALTTNPTLNPDTTYWVVIDGTNNTNNYYTIGANNNGYTNGTAGTAKIGRYSNTWGATTPPTADLFFNVYLGGMTGRIAGSSGSQWNQLHIATGGSGSAQAHTVNYTHSTGLIYCQSGTGNNQTCVNQTDPVYQPFPISAGNITQWKADANAGGIISTDYAVGGSSTVTLGPKRITGNLTVGGSGKLYLSGTLWVEGNITLSGSGKIILDPSYGSNSGVLIADGLINNGGSGQFLGSGDDGSYMLALTTSFCDSSFCSNDAIDVSGSAGSVVLYAANGTIEFTGSASAKEAVGYKMKLSGSANVTYESGLANQNFVSGPSGAWNISSWKEIK